MYDIAIVGGGPAGATLARLVGNKYKILLLEKHSAHSDSPGNEKCCGGLIDPDAQLMLARFGLGIPRQVLLSPQLFAVRTIDITNDVERYYQRHYINIDRGAFDRWLLSLAPEHVNVSSGALYKEHEEKNDHVVIKYKHNNIDFEEKARLLIGADGAYSKVRRQAFETWPTPRLYVSIQEWFEVSENRNCYGAIFDDEITDFYSWTIPKENHLILGTALKPGQDAHDKFELLKRRLSKYGYNFDKSVRRNGAYIYRPVRKSQICSGKGRIGLIGEAAGFISPSSAEGFSYAFRSALAAARALENGIEAFQEVYSKNLGSLYTNIFIKNLKSPAMYNKYLRKLIMKTGLMSLNIEK